MGGSSATVQPGALDQASRRDDAVERPRTGNLAYRCREGIGDRASAVLCEARFVAVCQLGGAPERGRHGLPRSWSSLRPVIRVEDRACRRIIADPACP